MRSYSPKGGAVKPSVLASNSALAFDAAQSQPRLAIGAPWADRLKRRNRVQDVMQSRSSRHHAAALTSEPIGETSRLMSLDILRGVALFGVMAINVVFEFRVSIFEQFLLPVDGSSLDSAITGFLHEAISLKAFALFSFLFGVGLAIQFDRLQARQRATLLVRRLLALLAFGLVHLVLIWNGDILTEYALAGLLVLPLLYAPRWLLGISALMMLALYSSFYLSRWAPLPDARWMADHVMEARRVYQSGGFSEILMFRIHEIPAIAPLHVLVFPRTLALFLLGALVWRANILPRASEQWWMFFGAAIALAVSTVLVTRPLATVSLALAYGAFIVGIASTASGARLLNWAAPLGRMAFTNYLAQSLIFGWIFYGYGLGMFGRLGVTNALALGVVVYVAQVLVSQWWLGRYRFGPVEWLWRALMYGRLPPMLRLKAA
jgi:uncharacterized protein